MLHKAIYVMNGRATKHNLIFLVNMLEKCNWPYRFLPLSYAIQIQIGLGRNAFRNYGILICLYVHILYIMGTNGSCNCPHVMNLKPNQTSCRAGGDSSFHIWIYLIMKRCLATYWSVVLPLGCLVSLWQQNINCTGGECHQPPSRRRWLCLIDQVPPPHPTPPLTNPPHSHKFLAWRVGGVRPSNPNPTPRPKTQTHWPSRTHSQLRWDLRSRKERKICTQAGRQTAPEPQTGKLADKQREGRVDRDASNDNTPQVFGAAWCKTMCFCTWSH